MHTCLRSWWSSFPMVRSLWRLRSSKQSSTKRWKRALEVVDHLGPGYYSCPVVDHPGPGYYSCPFLVEKVTGGWRMVIDLSGLDCYVTLTPFKKEMVSSVLGSIRRGIWCSRLTWRTHTSYSHPSRPSTLLPDRPVEQCLPVQGALLQPVHSSLGLYNGVFTGVGVGSQARESSPLVSGWLVSDFGFSSSSGRTLGAPFQAL